MAKESKFSKYWDENKVTIIPVLCMVCVLMLLGGIYVGNRKYSDAQWERRRAEKAQAAADSMKMIKDTIVLDTVNQRQK